VRGFGVGKQEFEMYGGTEVTDKTLDLLFKAP